MNWDDVREAIRAQVATLTGLQTEFRNAKNDFVNMEGPKGGNVVYLNFPSVASLGWDEFREEYDPDLDVDNAAPIRVNQNGIRNFTVSVLVESFQDDSNNSALHYVELVREGMSRPQVAEALDAAAGVYVYDVSASHDHSYTFDNNMVLASGLDLMCTLMVNIDQGQVGLGQGLDNQQYINEIVATGTFFEPGTTSTTAATFSLDIKGPGQP